MVRDYQKENAWAAQKYDEIRFKISKEQGIEFRQKLAKDGIKLFDWGKQQVEIFLKKDEK